MEQRSFRFGQENELYGSYFAPEARSGPAVILCPPFAEEAKCSVRVFVETARALASAGAACFRFDYFGTCDSEGGFREFSPARAIDDIVVASGKVRELSGAARLVLLGLRLGGALALAAAPRAGADAVVLWQPVVSGKTFFDLSIKRAMMRKQLIGFSGATADEKGLDADAVDLDGYELSKPAGEELRGLSCTEAARGYGGRVLLLQISHSAEISREHQQLAESCGGRLEFAAVICPPFWNRIDLSDASSVIRQTLTWLAP